MPSNFDSEALQYFVRYGSLENERERQKIAEWIDDWEPIPPDQTNIHAHYAKVINDFVSDAQINALLEEQDSVKEDLIKELLHLLHQVAEVPTEKYTNLPEQRLLEVFKSKDVVNQDLAIMRKSRYPEQPDWEQHYRDALKQAIQDEDEQHLQQYADLKDEISVTWQIAQEADQNPLKHLALKAQEPSLQHDFEAMTIEEFRDTWLKANNKYRRFLKERYPKSAVDLNAFDTAFRQIRKREAVIKHPILQQGKAAIAQAWADKIDEERIQKTLEQIDRLRRAALQKLYEKIAAIQALLAQLAPFLGSEGIPGRLWDLSEGHWKRMDMRTLQEYAALLEQRKDLAELAELLGRFRQAEAALEWEQYEETLYFQEEEIDYTGASELVGVVESDELSRLLPSELALFSDPTTEDIFYKRYLEKRLQTFDYIARLSIEQSEQSERQRQKKVEADKGPFILAVDTSGSMHGTPEYIAKVLAFALAKIAIKEKRQAYLISFSTQIKTLDLSKVHQALPQLIEFLQMSFHGGTDATPAVREAIRQMRDGHYKKADLLLVSDGVFGHLDAPTTREIDQLKASGNRFHALMIGGGYYEQALAFCDKVWQYHPSSDGVRTLVRIMQESLAAANEG